MIGIYKIKNIITEKEYIGKSLDIKKRWKQHKTFLNKNKHHSIKLQRAWNKYGKDNFIFEIIEICNNENLDEKELFYIKKANSKNKGYNCTLNNTKQTIRKVINYYTTFKDEINTFKEIKIKKYEEYSNNKFLTIEKYKTIKRIIEKTKDINSDIDLYNFIHNLYFNKQHKYLICFIPNIENIMKDYNGHHKYEILKFISKNVLTKEYL